MAGAVFVPLDVDAPASRREQILASAEPALVVTNDPETLAGAWLLAVLADGALAGSAARSPGDRALDRLACTIFTSGTRRPEGICMSHRAVIGFWRALVAHCGLQPDARVGSVAPLHFDLSLLDLGLAFGSHAELVLIDRLLAYAPRHFVRALGSAGVTQLNCVPWVWRMLLARAPEEVVGMSGLRATLFAGEVFPIDEVAQPRALQPDLRLINCFGQSESIACSFYDLPTPLPDVASPRIGPAQGRSCVAWCCRAAGAHDPRQIVRDRRRPGFAPGPTQGVSTRATVRQAGMTIACGRACLR